MPFDFSTVRGDSTFGLNSAVRGPAGAPGATGATGAAGSDGLSAGLKRTFDSSTSMADPGTGEIRLNNATLASVTAIAISSLSAITGNADESDFIATWGASTTSSDKARVIIKRISAPQNYAVYTVTAAATDNSTWLQLTVTHVSSSGTLTGDLSVEWSRTGDKGADGSGTFPGSSTDNAIVRFDGTGGTTTQNSAVLVDDSANIVPATTDVGALGTTLLMWADAFLASGAVVNFNNGDVTITHSSNSLAFAGGSSGYTFDAAVLPSANDAAAIGSASASFSDLFLASGAVINFNNGDVTATHSSNALAFAGASSGYTFDAVVSPASSDGAALGSSSVMWSDLFLASGGVINFNNGDVTVTHSSNTLALAGASSGYTFDAAVLPSANDAAALGSASVSWADLFLASGAVLNFNNGDVTVTHAANSLTFAGGVVSFGSANAETPVALSDGANVALDASLGNVFTLSAAGSRTMDAPSSPTNGQKIVIRHLASGGARTLTLTTGSAGAFRYGSDITTLTETASGKIDYIGCIYNGTDSRWDVVAYSKGY